MNYSTYHFTWKETVRYVVEGSLVAVILGYLFYRSILGVLLILPLLYFYLQRKKQQLMRERQWKLNLEFKDGIMALSAALEAGYSSEHAMEEAYDDLSRLYQNNSMIMKELSYMINQLHMNISIEKALEDFGHRSGVEDIISFSEVFQTAKRTGGDLITVIKSTTIIIGDKIDVKRDIITLIAAKRLEANLMKVTPLFFLMYLSLSSPGFLDPLYGNAFGIVIMSILLLLYLAAYLMIDRIIAIEV